MTLSTLRREARDAGASARRNLVPGTVKAVHNGDSDLARLAGSTPGQPLYTVTVVGRRFQEFDLVPGGQRHSGAGGAPGVRIVHRRRPLPGRSGSPDLPTRRCRRPLSVRQDMTTALSDHLLSRPDAAPRHQRRQSPGQV